MDCMSRHLVEAPVFANECGRELRQQLDSVKSVWDVVFRTTRRVSPLRGFGDLMTVNYLLLRS
jgi:hypothetical protein